MKIKTLIEKAINKLRVKKTGEKGTDISLCSGNNAGIARKKTETMDPREEWILKRLEKQGWRYSEDNDKKHLVLSYPDWVRAYDDTAAYFLMEKSNEFGEIGRFGNSVMNLFALYIELDNELNEFRHEIFETQCLLLTKSTEAVREKFYQEFGDEYINNTVNFDFETYQNDAFNLKRIYPIPNDPIVRYDIIYELNDHKLRLWQITDNTPSIRDADKEILVHLYGLLAGRKKFDTEGKHLFSGMELSDKEMIMVKCLYMVGTPSSYPQTIDE